MTIRDKHFMQQAIGLSRENVARQNTDCSSSANQACLIGKLDVPN